MFRRRRRSISLAAAVIRELGAALHNRPCRVYTSDVRVRVVGTGLSTHPDATMVCGQLETAPDDADAITNPVVIVEVLSDTTEAYDRGAKADHYGRTPPGGKDLGLSDGFLIELDGKV